MLNVSVTRSGQQGIGFFSKGEQAQNIIRVARIKKNLGAVISFAEDSARACGLEEKETLSLVLAVEEIFLYLVNSEGAGQDVELQSIDGDYYLQTAFVFSDTKLNLKAFNLTYQPEYRDEDDLTEIGLLLASRHVDRLRLTNEPNHMLRLALTKEKQYQPPDEHFESVPVKAGEAQVRPAGPIDAQLFALTALNHFERYKLPPFFYRPNKLSDMLASGDYACAIAENKDNDQVGGILWRCNGVKTAECYGPYMFTGESGLHLDARLLDACLKDVAGSPALNLINRYRGDRLPQGYFDELGSYSEYKKNKSSSVQVVFFRQMREDPGAAVWTSAQLDDFLVQEYRRLVLPREVEFVQKENQQKLDEHSVLSADLNREENTANLRLLWPGIDLVQNVADHVRLFQTEGWRNLSAEIDLGMACQAGFAEALLKNGFVPRLILPHGNQGDVVIFRRPPALNELVPEFVKKFEPYIPSRPPDVLKKQYHYQTLYHLNNNENALGPPRAAQKVLKEFNPFKAAFYPSGDSYHLRVKLAAYYNLHPDQFIVGNGANESVTLLIKAFCEMGDNIVTADKTYGGYEWVARFSGINARLTPLKKGTFDPEAIVEQIDSMTKIVFLCNPNNPTGTYWNKKMLTDFMEKINGRCMVVLDEAYVEFVDKVDFPDGMSLIQAYPNLVVFRTFSKMYGLAGLRIGYLAADNDVTNIIHRTAVVYSVNGPAQAAALAALGDQEHILRTREMVAAGKKFLYREIQALGLEGSSGEGNYFNVKLPFRDRLAYRRMMQQGVMVRMMTPFRFPNSIRITIAKQDAMQACVAALAQTLKER